MTQILNELIKQIKDPVEIIGISASFLVLISMLVKTTNFKGTIFMRIFNTIGSVIFVYYGIGIGTERILPAVILMNSLIIIINIIYIVKEIKDHKNNAKNMDI